MPIRTNSYYSDPGLGAGIESLGAALFGDPDTRIKGALAQAQGRHYDARTQDALADVAAKQAQLDAQRGMGDAIGNALFAEAQGPNMDGSAGYMVPRAPGEITQAMPGVLNSAALAYGDDAGALGEIFRLVAAMSGNDALARQGMVGAGTTPGENFALTPERADDIRAQGFDASYNETMDATALQQSGAMSREELAQAAAMERQELANANAIEQIFAKALEVSPGATAIFNPDDPRATQEGVGHLFTAPGKPSTAADRYVVTPNGDGTFSYQPVSPGLPAPTPSSAAGGGGSVLDVSPTDVKAIRDLIATFIPEGFQVDADTVARITTRATQLYQDSRDAQGAVADAWSEVMGASPTREGEGNPFVTNRLMPPKPGEGNAGATTPPAPVPAPEQRIKGQVYQTPKGAMMWTGTGWRPVDA